MRRSLACLVTAVVASSSLLAPQLARAAGGDDPQAQLQQVRAQQALAASEINTSKASLADIDQALQALDANVRSQEQLLREAAQAEADATRAARDAAAAVARITDERTLLHKIVANRAVSAFVNPPVDDLLTMLQSRDLNVANSRKLLVELRAQSDADLADRLLGLNRDLDHERALAVQARASAVQRRAEQRDRTRQVEQAKAAKQRVADGIQRRIDANLARSISLARTDRALSTQIALEQAALEARLVAQRAAAAQASASQAAASRRAAATTQPNAAGSGPISSVPSPGGNGLSLTTVGGITVASQIAGPLGALLSAARASGLTLSGSGYRDPAQQVALRQQHCGSSYYAIYQMSPGSCSPPTARPGTSMHEVGLAVDFDSCSSHGTACWQWLSQNAARFGFYNLPSEPWHWSINGN